MCKKSLNQTIDEHFCQYLAGIFSIAGENKKLQQLKRHWLQNIQKCNSSTILLGLQQSNSATV